MPNTRPPVTDAASLEAALQAAQSKARCDYAQYVGAGAENIESVYQLAPRAAGLKMYLDQTFGPLRLDDMTHWAGHFAHWPKGSPIAIHAEGRSIAAAILLASFYNQPVHICHVALREEILLIRAAKKHGLPVTCEVAPHHLFLSTADLERIGARRGEVRPRLASPADVQALWDNLDVIDCFATDHAPHTLAEKDSEQAPPGFPGLESALPLLLTAVAEKRLTLDDLLARCYTNPRKIFHLPEQPETWVEVDPDARWEIRAENCYTRCGWTPFEGMPVQGRVRRVVLRGREALRDGLVLAQPGEGRNVR